MIDVLASVLLSLLGLWLVGGACSSLLYRGRLRDWVQSVDPGQASNVLLLWLALPATFAVLSTALLFSPALSGPLVDSHCHGGHCASHSPLTPHALWPAFLLLAWHGWRLLRCGWGHWYQGMKTLRQLTACGVARGPVIELDTAQPAAFTLGWWRARIFLTRGLLEACSEQDVRCIVEHEQAHTARCDNLRTLTALALTSPLPRRLVQPVLDDLGLAHELAADRMAAGRCGPEAVAATLLKVARMQQGELPIGGTAFGATGTERRVLALLAEQPPLPDKHWRWFGLVAGTLVLTLVLTPLHHLLEVFTH